MSIKITQATEDDIPEIAHIHIEGWRGAYGGIVDSAYLDSLDVKERQKQWEEWFDEQNSPVLMGYIDDNPAGFVNFGKLRTPPPGMSPIRPLYSGEIYAIYLLPEFYRKGLGTALLKAAVRGLEEMRHKSMCLWVLEKNKRAGLFYKHLGGERCGKKMITVGPSEAREICYGWRDTNILMPDSQ